MDRGRSRLSLREDPGMYGPVSSSGLLIQGGGGLWICSGIRLQLASEETGPGNLGFMPRASLYCSHTETRRKMTATLLLTLEEEGQTEGSDKTKPNKKRREGKKEKQINGQINSLKSVRN